jgi:diguanylate cyclase (GGDEF)-like protein/PAS domain S-box-containing protein
MTRGRRELGKTRLPAWTAGFVALACVAILALSGWREWESRELDLHDAEVEMENLARSLTQHADDTFELTDTILVGLVDRLETEGTGPAAIEKIQRFLQLRKSTGRVHGIFVYDETGRWLATTEQVDLAGLNNSDRDYFQRHRASPDRGTLIGRPVKSRSGGQWIVTASRRFNHPDGRFAGVALTTIDVSYFSGFYEQFDVGAHGNVSLLSTDGIMLARSHDDGSNIGRDMSGSPLIREMHDRPAASVYYFKSPIDAVQRLSFYRKSDRYPILVLATRAEDEVLEGWRAEALARMAFVLGLTMIIAVFGCHLVRQLHRRQRMEVALAATEADFRLLAEHSSDMVVRIGLDRRIRYVSPSCARVIGWNAEQLMGTAALSGLHAEDLPRVQQTLEALNLGKVEEARIAYRNRHREKREIWVETALRVTRAPDTGEIDGVVAIVRDMTEHKDLQDRLAVLATSDGLTGLANRRQFDECLRDEWARAKRDGTPLSLLLIDVDHFKKFNDQYGHQAGDACLRLIAQAFASEARRPADLAARYGGEEFVLLLPNTDAEDCERIGERVRQAVRKLAVPHAQNPPSDQVTVSLGGATDLPAGGAAEYASLVEAADLALYTAKDGGRDRLVMSAQVLAWPQAKVRERVAAAI